MFPSDLEQQKSYLATAIALVVKNVEGLPVVDLALRELGKRHVGYGVRPEHYPAVRDAMLAAFAEAAGAAWTPQLHAVWHEAIERATSAMLRGGAAPGKRAA